MCIVSAYLQVQLLCEVLDCEWAVLYNWSEDRGSHMTLIHRDREYFALLWQVRVDPFQNPRPLMNREAMNPAQQQEWHEHCALPNYHVFSWQKPVLCAQVTIA